MASALEAIPVQLYMALVMTLSVAAILSFTIGGTKRVLYTMLVVVTIEVVVMIYCYTVFLRAVTYNWGVNLIPFWSYNMKSKDLQYSMYVENMMNILMFIPIGLLLGCLFKDMRWKKMLLIAICMSMSIEILQYILHRGLAEVDDVMHNALGAVIGFGLYKATAYIVCSIRSNKS